MSLEVEAWRGRAAFEALSAEWDALAREARLDPLCNAHAWNAAYARAWLDDEVFGWRFAERGRACGLIALRWEPSRGPLRLRRALWLGDGTFDSDYLCAPVRPGREREFAAGLIEAARGVSGLDALVLAGLPDDAALLAALRAELDMRGTPRREHAIEALATPLPGDFEAFLGGLKPRMRSKVRSARRAAAERGAALAWCRREQQLDEWLEHLYRLHELRWNAAGRAGSFAEPRRRAFYAELARGALARGELCFARLEEQGRVLATLFGLRLGERYYQIQEGFDPELGGERVGLALRGLALEELIESGVRVYDFMAG
ncbi:MAG TPA: GNAT family N-acetyltransferase, partial [Planctomycetota bacterium]|nr:GNAT family N-acetyltransferase [Planctomycetota bacterium]